MSKCINSSLLENAIEAYYLEKKGYPHCLIQSSNKEYKDLKDNSIHLGNINNSNKKRVEYGSVLHIGSNLKMKKRDVMLNDVGNTLEFIDISKTRKRVFCLTTYVKDILAAAPDTIIIPSNSRYDGKIHEEYKVQQHGIVLLFYAILPTKATSYDLDFNQDFAKMIKSVKDSTIKKGADHNGSTGLYYSFGNKGAYERIDNSTVGQYKTKTFKDDSKTMRLHSWCKSAETLIAMHLNESVISLKTYIRNISALISPVIDVAYKMQSKHGNVNLKAVETKNSGIWMSTIALNAQTSQFHSEDDCTYTLVKVPNQSKSMNLGNNHQRMFLLRINDKITYAFPLTHNLSFVYSGNFVTHRQHCDSSAYTDGSLFYNIVCYGNKRLYSHVKQSFLRNQK